MLDETNEIKRWTAKRKVQVVLDILKIKTTVVEVARHRCKLAPRSSAFIGLRTWRYVS